MSLHCHVHFKFLAGMASSEHFCSTCNLGFPFKSRLDKHMKSKDHLMFQKSLENFDDLDTAVHSEEVLIISYAC